MKIRHQKPETLFVIRGSAALMLIGMVVLLIELWQLQVPRKNGLEEVFRNQSVRRIRLPAVRGKIYDSKGICLADSIPNYCIAIYTEELYAPKSMVAKTLELSHEIWQRIGRKPDIGYRDIQRHLLFSPNEPLVLYKTLTPEEITVWRVAFEKWTEPPEGSLFRRRVPGLDLGHPLQGQSIVIETQALRKRGTSTAANTLELIYKITERL